MGDRLIPTRVRTHPLYGLALALGASLLLSPDTLLMRISGLSGVQMLAWRGLLMGAVMVLVWVLFTTDRRTDLRALASGAGGLAIVLQALNAILFVTGIAAAPVAVVLFAVATTPIWAAIMGWVFLGDSVGRATAATCAAVLVGIGLSVTGGAHGGGGGNAAIGALCGLAVAVSLAGSFNIYRARPDLPILLAVGIGAGIAGGVGYALSDTLAVGGARLAAISLTGLVILPLSFFLLSSASRHTSGANVSLFLLLETVLGPVFVWAALGEAVPIQGIVGGGIVVAALAVYLNHRRRKGSQDHQPDAVGHDPQRRYAQGPDQDEPANPLEHQ